jgi:hypothetical protein
MKSNKTNKIFYVKNFKDTNYHNFRGFFDEFIGGKWEPSTCFIDFLCKK